MLFLSIHQVPSVLFAPHHLLALFTLGVPSGLIMDCGFTETVVLPISFYDRQIPYLFDYKPISAISRDPKLWTCRLGVTRTKNKSKTLGYKPRPIHYYKTELLTTGKPNIFGKNHIDCHKWGLDDNTHARIQEMQWWFIIQKASLLENTCELINITRN